MRSAKAPGGARAVIATVACLAMIAVGCGSGSEGPELVAAPPTATPEPTPIPEPTPVPEPTPTVEAEVEAEEQTPTPEPTPAPDVWRVVDTVDGLNVRAEPTTSAAVAIRLEPGTGGLIGTGETATADGFDWLEIAATDDRPGGWVASNFVVPDTDAAVAPASSRVCFHSELDGDATTVIMDFAADAETFNGGVRLVLGENLEYQAAAGRRLADQGSVFTVALQGVGSSAVRTQEWQSFPEGVTLGDTGQADAVDCADIADLVDSIELNVVDFPDVPG